MTAPAILYANVTGKILGMMQAGAGDWRKPWIASGGGLPSNGVTGREYHGVNVLCLWAAAAEKGYASPLWASFPQWRNAGASVRKGERGTMIVYLGDASKNDATDAAEGDTDASKPRRVLRYFHVFNVAQVDAAEGSDWQPPKPPELPSLAQRIEAAEHLVGATGARIVNGHSRAFYQPAGDFVGMPHITAFRDTPTASATENYYGTLLHELTHWTGHPRRLDRNLSTRFGSDAYAAEELVAELGSAFLCAALGISAEPRQDHAQYLANWANVLRADDRAIFTAAARASDAAEYIRKLGAGESLPAAA